MAETLTDVLKGDWKPVETSGAASAEQVPAKRFMPGDVLEGKFLGSKLIAKTGGMRNDAWLHSIETADGVRDFWGQKDVNDKLATVTAGDPVRVEKTDQQKQVANGYLHIWIVQTKPAT